MHIYLSSDKKENKFLHRKLPFLDLTAAEKEELRKLVPAMRKIMKEANGIGLAANQIGIAKRIFVAQVPDDQGRQKFYCLINPVITKTSPETQNMEEGCLSVPGFYGFVERPAKITVEGYNLEGRRVKIKAWGLLARVFQHEIDHLDGKLFTERTKNIFKIEKKNQ